MAERESFDVSFEIDHRVKPLPEDIVTVMNMVVMGLITVPGIIFLEPLMHIVFACLISVTAGSACIVLWIKKEDKKRNKNAENNQSAMNAALEPHNVTTDYYDGGVHSLDKLTFTHNETGQRYSSVGSVNDNIVNMTIYREYDYSE